MGEAQPPSPKSPERGPSTSPCIPPLVTSSGEESDSIDFTLFDLYVLNQAYISNRKPLVPVQVGGASAPWSNQDFHREPVTSALDPPPMLCPTLSITLLALLMSNCPMPSVPASPPPTNLAAFPSPSAPEGTAWPTCECRRRREKSSARAPWRCGQDRAYHQRRGNCAE